ncbi:MAG: AI-2E family transporter [Candidatus Latescibacteria bacterium]|nr:AI-2E family transporter [Candidatus Latescibacterota bacterium]
MEIKRFGFYFLLGIIIALAIKFYTMIDSFLPSIATACVFAYILNPVYRYFLKITKNPSISSFLVILITAILILVPATFIITSIQEQIQNFFIKHSISQLHENLNNFDKILFDRFNIRIPEEYTTDLFMKLIAAGQEAITVLAPKMLFNITRYLVYTFLILFLLYYLFINSHQVIWTFSQYFPLSYKNIDVLLDECGKKTRSIILGQLLIAVIQGIIGALGFFIFDVPGAILWGVVMVIMSFLPIFGTSFIWLPASIGLMIQGNYFNGIGLFLWGGIIHNTMDNIIRPKVCATIGKTHPVTILLGVFIGLVEWGIIGLVLGPLVISVLLILIKMFREEYIDESTVATANSVE